MKGYKTIEWIEPYFKRLPGQSNNSAPQLILKGLIVSYYDTIEGLVDCQNSSELLHLFMVHRADQQNFLTGASRGPSCQADSCRVGEGRYKVRFDSLGRNLRKLAVKKRAGLRRSAKAKQAVAAGEPISQFKQCFYVLNEARDTQENFTSDEVRLKNVYLQICWDLDDIRMPVKKVLRLADLMQYAAANDYSWIDAFFDSELANCPKLKEELKKKLVNLDWQQYAPESNPNWVHVSRDMMNQQLFSRKQRRQAPEGNANDHAAPKRQPYQFLQHRYDQIKRGNRVVSSLLITSLEMLFY